MSSYVWSRAQETPRNDQATEPDPGHRCRAPGSGGIYDAAQNTDRRETKKQLTRKDSRALPNSPQVARPKQQGGGKNQFKKFQVAWGTPGRELSTFNATPPPPKNIQTPLGQRSLLWVNKKRKGNQRQKGKINLGNSKKPPKS